MLRTSADSFVDAVRQYQLLDTRKVQELTQLSEARGLDAHRLAQHALTNSWLTAYQINQIMQGRGASLQLGPYMLLERLGEGGMAVVYKARHRLINRIVALKLVRQEYLNNPSAVGRFRREVQAIARLSHPNIVMAIDADEVNGTHFFAMEYVEGITLTSLLKSRGPLAPTLVCDYMRQTASGLKHAHEKGLVHRDIKPSNLMLTSAPGSRSLDLVKILDMGLARLQVPDAEQESTELTQAGVVIGTPEFLAPEQAVNPHGADIRADLYSLGCTFYMLLTGNVPFPRGNTIEKLFQHRFEQAVPVDKVRSEIPRSVSVVVQKLMAKKPEDRYQDPAEVIGVLDKVLRDLPDPTHSKRNGGILLPSVLPALVRKFSSSWGAFQKAPAGNKKKHRLGGFLIAGVAVLVLAVATGVYFWLAVDNAPTVQAKRSEPRSPEETSRAVLRNLVAKADNPRTDARSIRQELAEFRMQYPATAQSARAAELFQQLASPLDALDANGVAPEDRIDGHQGADLVLVLGDARFRHGGGAWSVALSPDGKSVASGGEDRQVYVWDASNGKRQADFSAHTAPVSSVAWSPDGRFIVSGSHDWTARIWDVGSKKEKSQLQNPGGVRSVAISPDSKMIATGTQPAPGQDNGVIRLWDGDGKELFHLDGHKGPVLTLAFAPNGPFLASGGEDKTVRVWDLNQRKEIANLGGSQGPVLSVAYTADGNSLFTGGADKNLRIWDVGQKRERSGPRDLGNTIAGISCVPNSSLLGVALHDGTIRVLDVANGFQEKGTLRGHHGPVSAFVIANDGQRAVSAGQDGSIRSWDVPKLKDNHVHRKYGGIQAVALSPDDRTIATGHQGGKIRLWDPTTGKDVATLDRHQNGVPSLAFSPDGKTLLSGGWDNLAVVWDVAQRKDREQLRGHRAGVVATAFSPGGGLVVTGSHDGTVRMWEAVGGKEKGTLTGHAQGIMSLAFAPDGKTLATGAFERTIKLWNATTTKEIASYSEFTGESLAFLSDGKAIVSGTSHGSVCLWDVVSPRSGTSKPVSAPNLGWVKAMALSLDGKNLVLGNNDGRVVFWSLAQGKETRQWRLPGMANSLAFTADGRYLLCLLNNGNVYVFRLGPRPEKS